MPNKPLNYVDTSRHTLYLLYEGEKSANAIRKVIRDVEDLIIENYDAPKEYDGFLPLFSWSASINDSKEMVLRLEIPYTIVDLAGSRTGVTNPPIPPPPPRHPLPLIIPNLQFEQFLQEKKLSLNDVIIH